MRVAVLNGVNLDVLGRRDPEHLRRARRSHELETQIYDWARELECTARCRQTNHEGEFVDWCHDALDWAGRRRRQPRRLDALQLRDPRRARALQAPVVEVHLSNIDEREEWRRHSVIADLATKRDRRARAPRATARRSTFLAERPMSRVERLRRAARRAAARHEPASTSAT